MQFERTWGILTKCFQEHRDETGGCGVFLCRKFPWRSPHTMRAAGNSYDDGDVIFF